MDQLKENETEISEGNNPTLISSLGEPIASEELLVEKKNRKEKGSGVSRLIWAGRPGLGEGGQHREPRAWRPPTNTQKNKGLKPIEGSFPT